MDGTGLLFHPFVKLFPDDFECEIISYPSDKKLTYDQLVNYVKAKLPKEPFVLLAESFSGPIAYRLACDPSLAIEKIIFAASFITNPNPKLLLLTKLLPLKILLKLPIPKILLKRYCFGIFINKALCNLFFKALRSVRTEVLIDRIKSLNAIKQPTEVIKVPCLNIIASRDKLLSHEASLEISHFCENTTDIKVSAPHFVLQTIPNNLLINILRFISTG